MGKAARWFRRLFGLKKSESLSVTGVARYEPSPAKKICAVVKSQRELEGTANNSSHRRVSGVDVTRRSSDGGDGQNKQAITAALAVASSEGAEDIGGSTTAYVSGGSCGIREECAAIMIQAHFRAYLSRRALRALKALVKLQALVRGNIVRKQTAYMLQRMQTLLRAQARALAGRTHVSQSPHSWTKSFQFLNHGPATPEKYEPAIQTNSTKYIMLRKGYGSKSVGRSITDQDGTHCGWSCQMSETSGSQGGSSMRTLETYNQEQQHIIPKRRIQFRHSHRSVASDQISHSLTTTSKDSTTHQTLPSPSSGEVESLIPLFTQYVEDSKRGPSTPTMSERSRSYLSNCLDHPNYMSCTESSRAKLRSLSAPRQRPQFERSSSAQRYLFHGHGDPRSGALSVPAFRAIFDSKKGYPGSGHLDRLGMPVRSS